MKKMIDLRSDTVTHPTEEMRDFMKTAKVGDDVYGEDPTVNELEDFAASLLGKEAALFLPTGTQSNLTALLTHCQRGDEYIVGQEAHTFKYEGGGAAVLGSIQPQPINFELDGSLAIESIKSAIKPEDNHFARTKLICLENTQAGKALDLNYIANIRLLCDDYKLLFHLDGARFFNACVAKGLNPATLASNFNSVSVCLSKGLGAPVGSLLVGSEDFIYKARRWRKVLGGGMRQAGIVAAGGLFALKYHRERLVEDHLKAERTFEAIIEKFGENSASLATNMVHVNLSGTKYTEFVAYLKNHEVVLGSPRFVFHMGISESDLDRLIELISSFRLK